MYERRSAQIADPRIIQISDTEHEMIPRHHTLLIVSLDE